MPAACCISVRYLTGMPEDMRLIPEMSYPGWEQHASVTTSLGLLNMITKSKPGPSFRRKQAQRQMANERAGEAIADRLVARVERIQAMLLGRLIKERQIFRAGIAGGRLHKIHGGNHT